MEQARVAVMVAAALAAEAWNANAQDGDVAAGHAFAREACVTCHVVDPQMRRLGSLSSARTFRILQTPKG